MATDVDVRTVASFASVPESTVSALLDSPTLELVQAFLQSIATKAREYDELKSDKLRLEVELESAVRNGDSKVKGLRSSVEKGLAEVGKLRNELQESGRSLRVVIAVLLHCSDCTRKYAIETRP